VVNSNHDQVLSLPVRLKRLGEELVSNQIRDKGTKEQIDFLEKEHGSKKPEEIVSGREGRPEPDAQTLTEKEGA
jgi:hypothetical protein